MTGLSSPARSRLLLGLLDQVVGALVWVLKIPLGRQIDQKDPYTSIVGYQKDQLVAPVRTPGTTLRLLGYEGSRNVVFTFALIVVVSAIVWTVLPWKPTFMVPVVHLFSNSLFTASATILAFGVLDQLAPAAVWYAVRRLVLVRKRVFGTAMVCGLGDALRAAREERSELT